MSEREACICLQLKRSGFILEPDKSDREMNNEWTADKCCMEQHMYVFLPFIELKLNQTGCDSAVDVEKKCLCAHTVG